MYIKRHGKVNINGFCQKPCAQYRCIIVLKPITTDSASTLRVEGINLRLKCAPASIAVATGRMNVIAVSIVVTERKMA